MTVNETEVTQLHINYLKDSINNSIISKPASRKLLNAYFKAFRRINLSTLKVLTNELFVEFTNNQKHRDTRCQATAVMNRLTDKQKRLGNEMQNIDEKSNRYGEICDELNEILIKQVDYLIPETNITFDISGYEKIRSIFRKSILKKKSIDIIINVIIFFVGLAFACLSDRLLNLSEPLISFLSNFLNIELQNTNFIKTLLGFLFGIIIADPIRDFLHSYVFKENQAARLKNLEEVVTLYNLETKKYCNTLKIDETCLNSIFSEFKNLVSKN